MEQLIVTSPLNVDLTSLRQSIHALQAASMRLDTEKAEAEVGLRTILRKLKKKQAFVRKLYRKQKKCICKLAKYIGMECKTPEDGEPTDFMFVLIQSDTCRSVDHPQIPEEATAKGDETCSGCQSQAYRI